MQEITFTPEKAKQVALARLDLVHKWLEFRRLANSKCYEKKLYKPTNY